MFAIALGEADSVVSIDVGIVDEDNDNVGIGVEDTVHGHGSEMI